jgi:FkbM family methyltransferase
MVSRLCAVAALLAIAAAIALHIAGDGPAAETAGIVAFAALFAAAVIPTRETIAGQRAERLPPSTVLRRLLRPLFGPEAPGARAILASMRIFYGKTKSIAVRGLPFSIDLEDTGVGFELLCTGGFEPGETAFFKRLLQPGQRVADVGANIGYFTTLFAELVGPHGKVIAFEPDPRTLALLQKNVAERGVGDRVQIVHAAVGSAPGIAPLFVLDSGNRGDQRMYLTDPGEDRKAAARSRVDVRVVRFDDAIADWPQLDAIKMDIQGFEGHALAGMHASRARWPHVVMLVEYWPWGLRAAGSDPLEVLAELRRDAAVFELDARGALLPLDDDSMVDELQRSRRHINVVVGPPDRIRASGT